MSRPAFRVYFGGSFFPPHVGHDEMLVSLLAHPDVVEVHLVPTYQNPLKAPARLGDVSALKRSFMHAWQASLSKRGVVGFKKLRLDWRELDRGRASYTVETLGEMQREQAASALPWVLSVGADSLADFERWRDIESLLKQVQEVWVFSRGSLSHRNFLSEIPQRLRALSTWRLMLAEIKDVSSTELRRILETADGAERRTQLETLVLPELLEIL